MIDFESGVLRLVRGNSDLSGRQLAVLFSCRETPRTVRWLADDLKIAKPAVSRAIDRLADAGFAGRKDDPDDRRSILVALTRDGRKFLDALTR